MFICVKHVIDKVENETEREMERERDFDLMSNLQHSDDRMCVENTL